VGGVKKFGRKNDMDECDKGEEMNPMEYVSNNGEKISREEMPKCLTRKKCGFTWQPKHSCTIIDLVCFNLFIFLSPKG
jgi:hypothetical protein